MKALASVLFVVAVLAFAGGTFVPPPSVTFSRSLSPVVTASRDSPSDEDVDPYGNDVTHAVAEYSLDPAGSLYELHAPQVELPRLGSPKS